MIIPRMQIRIDLTKIYTITQIRLTTELLVFGIYESEKNVHLEKIQKSPILQEQDKYRSYTNFFFVYSSHLTCHVYLLNQPGYSRF